MKWAIRSLSLNFCEQNKQFAHSRLIVVSEMSDSLKATQLLWAEWLNRSGRSFLVSYREKFSQFDQDQNNQL